AVAMLSRICSASERRWSRSTAMRREFMVRAMVYRYCQFLVLFSVLCDAQTTLLSNHSPLLLKRYSAAVQADKEPQDANSNTYDPLWIAAGAVGQWPLHHLRVKRHQRYAE